MKIVTQNCCLDKFPISERFKTIAETIFSLNPDVIFLQEIFLKYWVNIFENPNYKQHLQTNGLTVKGGLLTLIKKDIFVKEIVFQKFDHQGNLHSMQIFDRIGGKGYLDVVLNNGLHLINTHLVATYSGRFVYDSNQFDQINQLISYFQKLEKVIIAGDFNTDRGGQYYQLMIRYLTDFAPKIECTSPNGKRNIDFVFGKGIDQKVSSAQLINYPSKNYPSDHKGILVEI